MGRLRKGGKEIMRSEKTPSSRNLFALGMWQKQRNERGKNERLSTVETSEQICLFFLYCSSDISNGTITLIVVKCA